MNEALKAIAGRRSIRQYREEQIKDGELKAILEAGLQAPSAHDDQSWHFSVIQNRELIDEISAGCKAEMRKAPVDWIAKLGEAEKYNIFYNAPTVIILAARKDAVAPLADVCAAQQNMVIAAESLGIGSCWMGFAKFYFADAQRYKKIGIPDGYEVFYGLTLGYKPQGWKASSRQRKYEDFYRIIK
ncbi:MAG TPA: nitroreductase family protein [Acidobacteriota bacterium]